jgi:hypothetical protein
MLPIAEWPNAPGLLGGLLSGGRWRCVHEGDADPCPTGTLIEVVVSRCGNAGKGGRGIGGWVCPVIVCAGTVTGGTSAMASVTAATTT